MSRAVLVAGALMIKLSIGMPAAAQTEAQCLQGFAVKPNKSVTYLVVDPSGQTKVSTNTMTCVDAERFRERLYISMDKGIYDSEQSLRGRLTAADSALTKLSADLAAANDEARTKALISGGSVTMATVSAIGMTAACASAVVNGAGVAACGGAVATSYAAMKEWSELVSSAQSWAATKTAAQAEITKQRARVTALSQQLDATRAKNIRDNYSALFVGICRAVKDQCL